LFRAAHAEYLKSINRTDAFKQRVEQAKQVAEADEMNPLKAENYLEAAIDVCNSVDQTFALSKEARTRAQDWAELTQHYGTKNDAADQQLQQSLKEEAAEQAKLFEIHGQYGARTNIQQNAKERRHYYETVTKPALFAAAREKRNAGLRQAAEASRAALEAVPEVDLGPPGDQHLKDRLKMFKEFLKQEEARLSQERQQDEAFGVSIDEIKYGLAQEFEPRKQELLRDFEKRRNERLERDKYDKSAVEAEMKKVPDLKKDYEQFINETADKVSYTKENFMRRHDVFEWFRIRYLLDFQKRLRASSVFARPTAAISDELFFRLPHTAAQFALYEQHRQDKEQAKNIVEVTDRIHRAVTNDENAKHEAVRDDIHKRVTALMQADRDKEKQGLPVKKGPMGMPRDHGIPIPPKRKWTIREMNRFLGRDAADDSDDALTQNHINEIVIQLGLTHDAATHIAAAIKESNFGDKTLAEIDEEKNVPPPTTWTVAEIENTVLQMRGEAAGPAAAGPSATARDIVNLVARIGVSAKEKAQLKKRMPYPPDTFPPEFTLEQIDNRIKEIKAEEARRKKEADDKKKAEAEEAERKQKEADKAKKQEEEDRKIAATIDQQGSKMDRQALRRFAGTAEVPGFMVPGVNINPEIQNTVVALVSRTLTLFHFEIGGREFDKRVKLAFFILINTFPTAFGDFQRMYFNKGVGGQAPQADMRIIEDELKRTIETDETIIELLRNLHQIERPDITEYDAKVKINNENTKPNALLDPNPSNRRRELSYEQGCVGTCFEDLERAQKLARLRQLMKGRTRKTYAELQKIAQEGKPRFVRTPWQEMSARNIASIWDFEGKIDPEVVLILGPVHLANQLQYFNTPAISRFFERGNEQQLVEFITRRAKKESHESPEESTFKTEGIAKTKKNIKEIRQQTENKDKALRKLIQELEEDPPSRPSDLAQPSKIEEIKILDALGIKHSLITISKAELYQEYSKKIFARFKKHGIEWFQTKADEFEALEAERAREIEREEERKRKRQTKKMDAERARQEAEQAKEAAERAKRLRTAVPPVPPGPNPPVPPGPNPPVPPGPKPPVPAGPNPPVPRPKPAVPPVNRVQPQPPVAPVVKLPIRLTPFPNFDWDRWDAKRQINGLSHETGILAWQCPKCKTINTTENCSSCNLKKQARADPKDGGRKGRPTRRSSRRRRKSCKKAGSGARRRASTRSRASRNSVRR
jgi:hypothetical protein